MFEQELYNQEVESHEGDLFHNYEVRNWNYSKRIYQILAVSAILNIFGLAFLANTEVLTARGCDSPFVGRVCQVLDTVYVGSVLFGTDREYVDAEYERIDLGDAEITYIDVSGATPPLSYPEGYFQIANPVQFAMQQQMAANPTTDFMPGFTPNPTIANDLISRPQVTPTPNPNAYDGETPPLFTTSPDKASRLRNRRPGKGNGLSDPDEQIADVDSNSNTSNPTDPDETPAVTPSENVTEKINKRAFTDLADSVNALITKKEINLETQFLVNATGKLNKDGKLGKETFRYTKAVSSDPKMIGVVKESIEAFNNSGFLQYLKDLSGKDLNLTVEQDGEKISATVQSEMERNTRAEAIAGLLKLGIDIAKGKKEKAIAEMQSKNDPEKALDLQNEIDDLELLKNTKVASDGKKLVINFTVPKEIIQKMIQRKLLERAEEAKKEGKKEDGTAQMKPIANTAKK